MGLPEIQYITIEEYLEEERVAQNKHEYFNGEIFAMSGASLPHNVVFRNAFGELFAKLEGKKCQPFGSDLRIHIPKNTLFTYPDISIICGEPEMFDTSFDTAMNPSVIIEILSKSTRTYDKGEKFTLYRDIPTLQEYILIDSESVRIEKFMRNDDESWLFTEYKSLDDTFTIDTIQETFLLSDIYLNVLG